MREVFLIGMGGTTVGQMGSFFWKNEVINVACAWDLISFLFFLL